MERQYALRGAHERGKVINNFSDTISYGYIDPLTFVSVAQTTGTISYLISRQMRGARVGMSDSSEFDSPYLHASHLFYASNTPIRRLGHIGCPRLVLSHTEAPFTDSLIGRPSVREATYEVPA